MWKPRRLPQVDTYLQCRGWEPQHFSEPSGCNRRLTPTTRKDVILMSATARNYAYVFKVKKDAPPVPVMTKECLERARAALKKYPIKK